MKYYDISRFARVNRVMYRNYVITLLWMNGYLKFGKRSH